MFFVATLNSELVMAMKPLPRFYKPGWNEKQKSFVDTVKCSFSKTVLIGDSIVSSLTRYHMIWSSTSNHTTPLSLVHLETVLRRELLAELEIAVIHGKIDVDKHPVNDIASGIIQIASNILNDKDQTSLSLGYIFYHKTNASPRLFQVRDVIVTITEDVSL